ncbi:Retinoblastoma-related protein [Acorus gramineus]|uniref:Retinoblastoma-related protein n=1 Tax=Acorus gramineus TaxID=55184 RepID=A0AAV9A7J8_ACOGR|nr:Retinoblastoma-related protein [Acorus gramineus]
MDEGEDGGEGKGEEGLGLDEEVEREGGGVWGVVEEGEGIVEALMVVVMASVGEEGVGEGEEEGGEGDGKKFNPVTYGVLSGIHRREVVVICADNLSFCESERTLDFRRAFGVPVEICWFVVEERGLYPLGFWRNLVFRFMSSKSAKAVDMEDVKPLIGSSVNDGDAMEARFADLCKSPLSLDESISRAAKALFRETKHLLLANMSVIGSGTPEEIERFWSAFVLYSVKRLRVGKEKQESEENVFSLCQILRVTKLSVVDFFKEMPQFCLKAGHVLNRIYGANWEKRLEVGPMILSLFSTEEYFVETKKSNKGVDLLESLCHKYDTSKEELRVTMEKANKLIIDILKKKPFPASECKTESLENINTEGLTYFEDLMEDKTLLFSLITLEKDYDDAVHNKVELDERVFINEGDSLLGSGSLSGGAINLSSSKRKLEMITSPVKTITSPRSPLCSPMSPANSSFTGNSKFAPTPVSTAMTTAKWLRNVISSLPSNPSGELGRFFSSCDKDVTNEITCRASIILGAIFPNSYLGERSGTSVMDNLWAEQRKMEALKLYYRVLEAICRAESQPSNGNNLNSLLTNERFHRCMLACSAELVLATHKTVTMMFPAVLERTGITAYDLSKVIEGIVRHEESLPKELRRHLNNLEERLLESMAWEKGSSMYNSLIIAKPALAAEINRIGLLADPMPSLDAIAMNHNVPAAGLLPLPAIKHEISPDKNSGTSSPKRLCTEYRNVLVERNFFTSPIKDRVSSLKSRSAFQSAFASPTRPNPAGGGETCAEAGMNVFNSKILKLAAVRVRNLAERLHLSQQVVERVYFLVQQILSQQTTLFFNRHIDQIILCSLYGVAKEIISSYRRQPHCKPQVFRSVFIAWPLTHRSGRTGKEHVDIITFYNEIFIPSVRPLLVDLDSGVSTSNHNRLEDNKIADGQCPGTPRACPFPSLPDMSPKKVSAGHNIYVSPLRSSKKDILLSPSSRSYYACIGESTHAYQSPSKDLKAINNHLNSGRKVCGKLNFEGLVSDSLVAGSLCPQNSSSIPSSSFTRLNLALKYEQPDA